MSVITKSHGPCVIIAGAGTGKTYTIVEKVKHLVENAIYPAEKIVCITFSNEAANNLTVRIRKKITGANPIIRTFHGFSADLLRMHGNQVDIAKDFKILDTDQAKIVLHKNLRIPAGNCHKYMGTIGTAKDLGITLEELSQYFLAKSKRFADIDIQKRLELLTFELQTIHITNEWKKKKLIVSEINQIKNLIELKKFINAWNAYEKLKRKNNYQDYSDLNKNALLLLRKDPNLTNSYEYIIIDEFQDTNKMQLDFVTELAKNRNVTIVGDSNQSIYRFRGAYRENLQAFKNSFAVTEADTFTLAQSYRSPNRILRIAHKLISNNYKNQNECLFVKNIHNREGDKIEVHELKDAREEARKIVEIIQQEQQRGTQIEEICVMFRAHQYGRIIRRALEHKNIPYVAVSKSSLLKQKSVKTARDFLIILDKLKRKEKGGEQAWWDLVYTLGFPASDLIIMGKALKAFTREKEKKENNGKDIISTYVLNTLEGLNLSEKGHCAAKILIEKIKALLHQIDKPISQLIKEVYMIGGLINEQRTKQEKEIMLNLNKFYEIAKSHEELYDADLNNFLYYLEILESLNIEVEASTLEEAGVRLMTSHATKGLEFKTVIVTNMAQGRFPVERYVTNPLIPTELLPDAKEELKQCNEEKEAFLVQYEKYHQLLEERRLAYVSFTRAKERLILTFAAQYGTKRTAPSQFLEEIGYKDNPDIQFTIDSDQKAHESELFPALTIPSVDAPNFEQSLDVILKAGENKEEHRKLSPSALLLFDKCQKQFEYKYVYNMPEQKTLSWEAMRLGSFVHIVLEKGVSAGFSALEEFIQLAQALRLEEDWESVELQEAEILIRVFFARNRSRYNEKSKTEQYLALKLADIDFMGFADRIDFTLKGAEIIDYKTGKMTIALKDRNWQLGFYALAAKHQYGSVSRVILDMLKQEKPLEFSIDKEGNARCESSHYINGFNIYDIEQELIETAKAIQSAYKNGFKACPIEKNCDFCNEYVYGF